MSLVPWKSTSMPSVFRPRIGDELTAFQREMNSLMSNFFNRGDLSVPQSFIAGSYPAMDLREKDNKYLIDLDVPGMTAADIDMDFHDNTLTVKGETKSEKETKDIDWVCVERSRGSFRRDIYLDDEIDKENIKADLKDGVLHVELIKKAKTPTNHKKISIKH